MRRRAATGALTDDDRATIPECFRTLLKHLASPRSETTSNTANQSDYTSMVRDGTPVPFDFAIGRRKLGGIAKKKAPGLSGNGPDLYVYEAVRSHSS